MALSITYSDMSSKRFQIKKKNVIALSEFLLKTLGFKNAELSISFVTPQAMKKTNFTYRHKNTSTDVLSFPQENWDTPINPQNNAENQRQIKKISSRGLFLLLGDLVICPEVVNHNAKLLNQRLSREMSFMIIHGLLHLCGHDHIKKEEEKRMCNAQNILLDRAKEESPASMRNLIAYLGNKPK